MIGHQRLKETGWTNKKSKKESKEKYFYVYFFHQLIKNLINKQTFDAFTKQLPVYFDRFEMPYNIWCGGCNSHIGMGVRYNAEKSKVGNYYTTPIYKFRMKCHLCDNHFEIQTDPKVISTVSSGWWCSFWRCLFTCHVNPLGPSLATALSLQKPMWREVTVSNDPGLQL